MKLHKNRMISLGDIEVEDIKGFTPHNIVSHRMKDIFMDVPENLRNIARELIANDWRIYVVSQSRGRCYYRAKVITIPLWCLDNPKGEGYKI